jgi:hypothetical protein
MANFCEVNKLHLLSPIPGQSLMFLVGAGMSADLPQVAPVLGGLSDFLVGRENGKHMVTPPPKKNQNNEKKGVSHRKNENLARMIRFEYAVQLCKDYFGDVSFLREIYPFGAIPPNGYHFMLARLLSEQGWPIFSTNFDMQIESAWKDLYPNSALQRAFTPEQFNIWLNSYNAKKWMKPGLFKLHGSLEPVSTIHDDTLGVAFDALHVSTPHTHPPMKMLQAWLPKRALCVAGYGGGDDLDINVILRDTKAWDQWLYWFIHKKTDFSSALLFEDALKADVNISDRPFKLLMQLVKSNARDPKKIAIIYGRTDKNLAAFFAMRGIKVDIRKCNGPGYLQTRTAIAERLNKWAAKRGPSTQFRAHLIGFDLGFSYNEKTVDRIASRVAKAKTSYAEEDIAKLLVFAQTAYQNDDFDKAIKLCTKGLDQIEKKRLHFSKAKYSSRSGTLLRDSKMGLYIWKAESARMKEYWDIVDETVSEGLACSKTLRQRALRFKGDLLATQARSLTLRGILPKAISIGKQAVKNYLNSGEVFQGLWAELDVATSFKHKGELKKAWQLLDNLSDRVSDAGWDDWILDQVRLSQADLKAMMGLTLNHDEWVQLDRILKSSGDKFQKNETKAVILAFKCSNRLQGSGVKESYRKLDSQWMQLEKFWSNSVEGDEDELNCVRLFYADFIKAKGPDIGEIRRALKIIHKVVVSAIKRRTIITQLYGRLVLEDINRILGAECQWGDLANDYAKLSCSQGRAMAILLGCLSTDKPSSKDRSWAKKYAQDNEFDWLKQALDDYYNLPLDVAVSIRVSFWFPSSLTV